MSPPRKKTKKDDVAAPVAPQTGVIRFEVEDVSSLDNVGRFSPEVELGGVTWRANVFKTCFDSSVVTDLSIYLYCMHDQSTPWNIDVTSELTLVNADSSKNIIKITTDKFYDDDALFGDTHLCWEELMDEKRGFIKDDSITVEIRFSILAMKGLRLRPRIDFTDANEPCHDLALLFEGEKIFVNKGMLARHSSVFKAMFYGNFEEKDKNEIELKGIDRTEFLEMLDLVYASGKKITEGSVEHLLMLGDRFQIACVMEPVEKFLSDSTVISKNEKLRLADKYRLTGLLDACISNLKTRKDFKQLNESSIFRNLSDATKETLFKLLVEKSFAD